MDKSGLVKIFAVLTLCQAYGSCTDPRRADVIANLDKINDSFSNLEELLEKYTTLSTRLFYGLNGEFDVTNREVGYINDSINFEACQQYYDTIKNILEKATNLFTLYIKNDVNSVNKSITDHKNDYTTLYKQLNKTCTETTCPSSFATTVADALKKILGEYTSENATYQNNEKTEKSMLNSGITEIQGNSTMLFKCMLKIECDAFSEMITGDVISLQNNDYAVQKQQNVSAELTKRVDKYSSASNKIVNDFGNRINFSECILYLDIDNISTIFFQNATPLYQEDLKALELMQPDADFCKKMEDQFDTCTLHDLACYVGVFRTVQDKNLQANKTAGHAKYLVDNLYYQVTYIQHPPEEAKDHFFCKMKKIDELCNGSFKISSTFTLILIINSLLFHKLL